MVNAGSRPEDNKTRKGDGFPNQRFVVVPERVLDRCKNLSVVNNLFVTHIGAFPTAPNHYLERPAGSRHAIFIYCLAGTGWLETDEDTFEIDKGCGLFIPPREHHIYQADKDDPWSIFWVHFDGSLVDDIFEWLEVNPGHPVLHMPDTALMHKLFENIFACLKYNYSNAGLLTMSSEFMRFIAYIKMNATFPDTKVRKELSRIDESIEFMKNHLDITLSLEYLAKQAGQSVSVYRKRFKQKTGESPINFHIQLKMTKACELLDNTDMHIHDIAELLGYDDPGYFSRYFRNVQGCSPSSYRKSVKS